VRPCWWRGSLGGYGRWLRLYKKAARMPVIGWAVNFLERPIAL